jgi:DNA-binding CsgD family transcriptional regulator/tetratricopeptide (TPR) repeat protein
MDLIERDDFLASLHNGFRKAAAAEGHCFFIIGEAGIGKTSLVKTFLKEIEDDSIEYIGACDSLFTPRPLAPLYDLALQINEDWVDKIHSISSRAELFTKFVQVLTHKQRPVVVVFEDIHWADEATLDFIKFFARRISRTKCLFVLTARDDEINQQHSLRNVLADLSPDTFTRIELPPLSKEAVQKLADEKGYDGEDVYSITSGNPFYVNEILASYSAGVPHNIKDSVLSVYNNLEDDAKNLWQQLSVIPEGLEVERLNKIAHSWHEAIGNCIAIRILIIKNNKIRFKHELYRRTIEGSLSPFRRISLNKNLLDLFLECFQERGEIEKIVHYAKNANENELVVKYAPLAAQQAASVGSHIEASRLFLTAIEYSEGTDDCELVKFYEKYAYECYLTNQIREAITYQGKALKIWKGKNQIEQIGNSERFLSRLWWFEGNHQQSESFGQKAVEVLDNQPSSKAKAMAYSNMAHLKMLSDATDDCIYWAKKAIEIASQIGDEETLVHAKTSIGATMMLNPSTSEKGLAFLQESLEVSLKNSYHEHAGRAYAALSSISVTTNNYELARKTLEEGINYCEERDLNSLKLYMVCWKAIVNLEMGNWNEAFCIADNLLKKEGLLPVIKIGSLTTVAILRIRRGDLDALSLLHEAKTMAFKTTELQQIIPVLTALLEYEWLTGKRQVEQDLLDHIISRFLHTKMFSQSRFIFWLKKLGRQNSLINEIFKPGTPIDVPIGVQGAIAWEQLGCSYEQALCLFEGRDHDKRKALSIIQHLGATAVSEKFKMEMRSSGIKKIPRGLRASTKFNPAQLTNRELEVLELLKTGIQNKDIAEALFISPKTVDHHISSILFKLSVSSRSKAVTEAVRLGILK